MRPESYRALLEPRSVAIIGASDDGLKSSGRPQRYLAKYRFQGDVHPINPTRSFVQGQVSFAHLREVDTAVDLVVVLTPAANSLEAVAACVEREVPAVVLIPSGFAELNAEGAQLQDDLLAMVAGTGTRVLGPNCVGVVSVRSRLAVTIATGLDQDRFALKDGGVGLVTQSGAMGAFVFNTAQSRGVGLGVMVSTGNEMDITFSEMLAAMVEDPKIKGILGYIEGIRDGEVFVSALRRARELNKPIGFLKVGRSEIAKHAVASHTGALAGADEIYAGVFEQYGVWRIRGIGELVDWAQMIDSASAPRGKRVSIVTTSGGGGILVADYCADLGLELAQLDGQWKQRLIQLLPSYVVAQNPVDMGPSAGDPLALAKVLDLLIEHTETDVVFVLIGNLEQTEDALIDVFAKASARTDKPVVVVWVGGSGRPIAELSRIGVPAYADPWPALLAVRALVGSAGPSAGGTTIESVRTIDTDRVARGSRRLASARAAGQRILDEHQTKELLAAYGLRSPDEIVASSADEAASAALTLGFPIALKILSAEVNHKTDIGGVVLGLTSEHEVRRAARDMAARIDSVSSNGSGFLVQRMIPPGLEMLAGLKYDNVFGTVLVFGLGGIWTETFADVQVRRPSASREAIREALGRLRASPVLEANRGRAQRDIDAIVDTLDGLAHLVAEIGDEVLELDINPLIVGAAGEGAYVADALLVLRE